MNNKEAIEVIGQFSRIVDNESWLPNAQKAIKEASSLAIKALKDRSQGEWIYGEDECGQDGWFCSECGFFVPWYYEFYENDINFIREYKACPHCLAEMVTYTGKDRDMRGGRA